MASVTAGNRIIPKQCAVIGVAITTYELFPSDTFTDADGDTITYSAPSPWTPTGRQLLTATGGVRFYPTTRLAYGTPGGDLVGGNEYSTSIIATSSDTSTASLPTVWLIGASGSAYPRYTVTSSKKEFSYTVSDATSGTEVGSPTATAGTATPDQYAIVWSSENNVGDSEGTNRSPFSINNSGLITVSGTLAIQTYKLAVRATYSTNGLFDQCWVTITSTVAGGATGGYKMIDGGFGGLCR